MRRIVQQPELMSGAMCLGEHGHREVPWRSLEQSLREAGAKPGTLLQLIDEQPVVLRGVAIPVAELRRGVRAFGLPDVRREILGSRAELEMGIVGVPLHRVKSVERRTRRVERHVEHRDAAAGIAQHVPERGIPHQLLRAQAVLVVVAGLELLQPVDSVLSRGESGIERRPGGPVIKPVESAGRTRKTLAKESSDVGERPVLGPFGEKGRARGVEGYGENSRRHRVKLPADGP
jgi:hypothetical protein